jgi:hypothetical protein
MVEVCFFLHLMIFDCCVEQKQDDYKSNKKDTEKSVNSPLIGKTEGNHKKASTITGGPQVEIQIQYCPIAHNVISWMGTYN